MSDSQACVVVGAGMAGIAAAAALRVAGHTVTIVERDPLAFDAAPRRGVPQGHQLHNLLTRAQRHLEDLLPGFRDALLAEGAGEAGVSEETYVFEFGVEMPRRDLGMRLMCAPRPTIEHVARRLLLDGDGVTIVDGTQVEGLAVEEGQVSGVAVLRDGRRGHLPAKLVVDASGTRAAGMRWLRAAGWSEPPVQASRIERWYVSTQVLRPREWVGRDAFWMIFPTAPRTRGGLVAPVESDRWYVSFSGGAGDEPPRTMADLRRYARTLEAPWIAELLEAGQPLTAPHRFRKPTATWRRYDLVGDPLSGLLPIGDAVASLNPLFGQGMSVAAWQAAELARLLAEPAHAGEADVALTRGYLKHAAEPCRAAWRLGEEIEPPSPEAARTLAGELTADEALHREYVRSWHLVGAGPASDRDPHPTGAIA